MEAGTPDLVRLEDLRLPGQLTGRKKNNEKDKKEGDHSKFNNISMPYFTLYV